MEEFTRSFNGQFVYFNDIVASISDELPHPLPPVTFSKADLRALQLHQASAQDAINSTVLNAAARAKTQAIQAIGGMPVKQLTSGSSNSAYLTPTQITLRQ